MKILKLIGRWLGRLLLGTIVVLGFTTIALGLLTAALVMLPGGLIVWALISLSDL